MWLCSVPGAGYQGSIITRTSAKQRAGTMPFTGATQRGTTCTVGEPRTAKIWLATKILLNVVL